jgi:hypothetical protein
LTQGVAHWGPAQPGPQPLQSPPAQWPPALLWRQRHRPLSESQVPWPEHGGRDAFSILKPPPARPILVSPEHVYDVLGQHRKECGKGTRGIQKAQSAGLPSQAQLHAATITAASQGGKRAKKGTNCHIPRRCISGAGAWLPGAGQVTRHPSEAQLAGARPVPSAGVL